MISNYKQQSVLVYIVLILLGLQNGFHVIGYIIFSIFQNDFRYVTQVLINLKPPLVKYMHVVAWVIW